MGERAKYLGLVFAIAFSTFLLENQTSIFAGILKRTASQVIDITDADVWVMDPRTQYFEQTRALKDTDLFRVRGVPGVRYAVRLFKGTPVARAPDGTFSQTIALGLDDATLVGAPRKMLLGSWERLREPDAIVIDKAGYVLLFPGQPLELGRTLELNDHKVTIVGISEASAPFVSFPVIHTRYSEAIDFQGRERKQLSFVLSRPEPGVGAAELARRIEAGTGLRARTTDEFRWDCIRYYLANTGIPMNFGITIAVALIVGTVVAEQTFYLFTVENLKQFGALKAIGVTNRRLVGISSCSFVRRATRKKFTMTKSALTMTKSKAGIALIEGDEGLENSGHSWLTQPIRHHRNGNISIEPNCPWPDQASAFLTLRPKKTRNSTEELESPPEIEIIATALSFPGALVLDGALMPRRGWTSLRDTEAPAEHTSPGECRRERGTDWAPSPGRCSWQLLQPGGGEQVPRGSGRRVCPYQVHEGGPGHLGGQQFPHLL